LIVSIKLSCLKKEIKLLVLDRLINVISERYLMTEYLMLVDEDDKIVGKAERKEVVRNALLHRGAVVIVLNSEDQIFVHKRTNTKGLYPSHYDMFFGGSVQYNETYEAAAKRELGEESGIEAPIKRLFGFKYRSPTHNTNFEVFLCVYDGELTLQEDEVERGYFVDMESLEEMIKTKKFCPDSLLMFREYCKQFANYK